MSQFRACDICGTKGMNSDYYAHHMTRCHRLCDKCGGALMVAEVIVMDPVREVWIRRATGVCQGCLDALNLPRRT
jgi:hypothetical protein